MTLLRDGFAVMRRAREGMLSESEGQSYYPWGRVEGGAPLTIPPLLRRHPPSKKTASTYLEV